MVLLRLVVTITVMLILAGVSLNALMGENGLLTQAKNSKIMSEIAVLEEFLQEKYVDVYEYSSMNDSDDKLTILQNKYPEYFYIPANEGIGNLRYLVDSERTCIISYKKIWTT